MIEIEEITKRFEEKTVLDSLSLSVARGEILAVLGPNGCGKTTLLKCLCGLYIPVSGRITIDGLDRRRDHLAIRRFTAWLADQPYLYPRLSGREWLRSIADIYGVDRTTGGERMTALLDTFDLTAIADDPIAWYSNGQYKKLAIAAALVPGARLLLLDEPFSGEIDPPGMAALREILAALAERGTTIVFTTQIVDQADKLAHRVGLMHGGQIAACSSPAELCRQHGVATLEDVLRGLKSSAISGAPQHFLDTLGD